MFSLLFLYALLSRFYIGCDLCTNWYHGECVGITEKEAKKMDDYVCVECRRGRDGGGGTGGGSAGTGTGGGGGGEELYCICQTPYDESQ